ncbi:Hydantoinase B/oxoprolinase-domain-containing protein [Mycena floridula]|nr:Hydantoinase B/oxoprolinase-domain-containing protein [Mycena floridula]
MPSTPKDRTGRITIAIDRGGTFTDVLGIVPGWDRDIVIKLLSVDPDNYLDAPTEGIRRVLELALGDPIPRGQILDTSEIEVIRQGTTVATNALLERKGVKSALVITKGFKDLLYIGNQTRPDLFALNIQKPGVLFEKVVEVDERVTIADSVGDDARDLVSDDRRGSAGDAPRPLNLPENFVRGVSGDVVHILKHLDQDAVLADLKGLWEDGFRSIAIVFAHSYTFPHHEHIAHNLALQVGFTHISVSSSLQAMAKMVPRGASATADAYLTPHIKGYLDSFRRGFIGNLEQGNTRVEFMQSDGGLVNFRAFSGLRSILSGPAGGVVGYARTSYYPQDRIGVIGFDMGGTSTDVSRYAGTLEHVFETITAGVHIQTPQCDISTVASGGGSILFWRNGLFVVGPESAGAHPGPACYRKGGPLTITDANLFLGRIQPEYFPKIFGPSEDMPLDVEIVQRMFRELTEEINRDIRRINGDIGGCKTVEEVASGFLAVANESMARPIRSLSEGRGYSLKNHNLASFGGAGGQHACTLARILGINQVIIHKYSSILSAYGMALADVVSEQTMPASEVWDAVRRSEGLNAKLDKLIARARDELQNQVDKDTELVFDKFLFMRYEGSDTQLLVPEPRDGDYGKSFLEMHQKEFQFTLPRKILVDNVRVRGVGVSRESRKDEGAKLYTQLAETTPQPIDGSTATSIAQVYFQDTGHVATPIFLLDKLSPGNRITGPAILIDGTQTLLITPGATATILPSHVIIDVGLGEKRELSTEVVDPIMTSVFGHRFMAIAEMMGRTLQKTSVSLQIKERLDFSCAIFDEEGYLVANAPHVPVHLGAMSYCVQFQLKYWEGRLKRGDVLVSNHPQAGGSHLPDITVVTPVFGVQDEIIFFVASRGHHGDIGGLDANSMPPNSTEIWQEGAQIMSMKLVSDGKFNEPEITKIFQQAGEYPQCAASRRIQDNLTDLQAQVAANAVGVSYIEKLFQEFGGVVVRAYMRAIRDNAEIAVRKLFRDTVRKMGKRRLYAVDYMDNGAAIQLTITLDEETGSAVFDFEGSSPEVHANTNAPEAVVRSALTYCMRCLVGTDMPLNAGVMVPITLVVPPNSIVNPSEWAAVSSGNTEVSQRVVDVVFKAFGAVAGSQGCMNVFQFNYGEYHYGETICGGSGAGPGWVGTHGVHVHMTNTRITDIETIEKRFPVVVWEFSVREGSGGGGLFTGGNGVHREFEFSRPVDAFLIGERRVTEPYGMEGGAPGQRGAHYWVRKAPDGGERVVNVGGRATLHVQPGERIVIHTPGGGGWGALPDKDLTSIKEELTLVRKDKQSTMKQDDAEKPAERPFWRATGSIASYAAAQNEGG